MVNLLGITLDSKLTWSGYITSVCNRLSRVLYLLRKLKSFGTMNYLKYAYYAFFTVYFTMAYIYGANVNNILILQKKALRIITNSPLKAHCHPIFRSTNILTVINQYIYDFDNSC